MGKSYLKNKGIFTVQAKDCRVRVKQISAESGSRNFPTLIFLHEGLGCLEMWRDFPETLCSSLQMQGLVYERRGYGKSDMLPEGHWSADYLVTESEKYLSAVLDAWGIGECILIGHSDGGSIALIAAALMKDRIKAVITEAAHIYNEEITRAGIREVVKMYETGNLREKLCRYHGKYTDAVFYRWADTWLSEEFVTWNIEKFLPDVQCPFLLIQGENDEYATLKHAQDIARQVSGPVNMEIIPQCGHVPHFQAGERVLELMKDFIRNYEKMQPGLPFCAAAHEQTEACFRLVSGNVF
ncbi:MAG: alpha/beta fold hydrolase [Desulfococcaceae bacterium]